MFQSQVGRKSMPSVRWNLLSVQISTAKLTLNLTFGTSVETGAKFKALFLCVNSEIKEFVVKSIYLSEQAIRKLVAPENRRRSVRRNHLETRLPDAKLNSLFFWV